MTSLKYRPEIDGLRAIAVLSVIFYHGNVNLFSGGFSGVDIFFVISGYLITSIIIKQIRAEQFSLLEFYEKRIRRIIPALYFVVFTSIILSVFILNPNDLRDFFQSVLATPIFATNILFWREIDYFSTSVDFKPLVHFWSLSVEEQYYFLFPVFLMILWKRNKFELTTYFLIVVCALSLLLAEWAVHTMPTAAFYLLPTRMWEILLGSLCAIKLYNSNGSKNSNIFSALGLVLIIFSIFYLDDNTRPPGLFILFPTIGAAIIILYSQGTIVESILKSRFLVSIGLISYSLYLWHNVVFVFYRHLLGVELLNGWHFVCLVFLIFCLSYLSWRLVERPFRDRGAISRRFVIGYFVVGSIGFVLVGVAGHVTNGFEQQFIKYRLNDRQQKVYNLIQKSSSYDMFATMFDDGSCSFWAPVLDGEFLSRFEKCKKQHGNALIVLGDSHGMNVYNIFAKSGLNPFTVGFAVAGCRPHDQNPDCQYQDFLKFIKEIDTQNVNIVYHQSGSYYVRDENGYVDSTQAFQSGQSYSFDMENVKKTVDYLKEIQSIKKVVWLGPFTEMRKYFKKIDFILNEEYIVNPRSIAIFNELDDILRKISAENNINYVSFDSVYEIDREFFADDDCVRYRDKDHFSLCGEQYLARKLRETGLKILN